MKEPHAAPKPRVADPWARLPFSNETVQECIEDMAMDVEEQVE